MSFTAVIPAHNRAELIGRAIASAWGQSEPPVAVVVVDDGSTDTTGQVARAAGAQVIEIAEPGGSGPARNAGVAAASTEWVAFLDSDDEWRPGHLASLRSLAGGNILVSAPAASTFGAGRGLVSAAPEQVDPPTVFAALNPIVTSGTAVRRDVFLAAGGFRPLPRAQDFDCWLRVLERGPGLITGNQTVMYHEHAGQASRDGDLNRQCILQIVADASTRPWCTPTLTHRVLGTFFVNDLRGGHRERDWPRVVRTARAAAGYPRAWPWIVRSAAARTTDRLRPSTASAIR